MKWHLSQPNGRRRNAKHFTGWLAGKWKAVGYEKIDTGDSNGNTEADSLKLELAKPVDGEAMELAVAEAMEEVEDLDDPEELHDPEEEKSPAEGEAVDSEYDQTRPKVGESLMTQAASDEML